MAAAVDRADWFNLRAERKRVKVETPIRRSNSRLQEFKLALASTVRYESTVHYSSESDQNSAQDWLKPEKYRCSTALPSALCPASTHF